MPEARKIPVDAKIPMAFSKTSIRYLQVSVQTKARVKMMEENEQRVIVIQKQVKTYFHHLKFYSILFLNNNYSFIEIRNK